MAAFRVASATPSGSKRPPWQRWRTSSFWTWRRTWLTVNGWGANRILYNHVNQTKKLSCYRQTGFNLQISLYSTQATKEVTKEEIIFSAIDLVASIGGYLGLFLGASVFSIYHSFAEFGLRWLKWFETFDWNFIHLMFKIVNKCTKIVD